MLCSQASLCREWHAFWKTTPAAQVDFGPRWSVWYHDTKQLQLGFLFQLFHYFMFTGILSTAPNNSLGTEKPGHLDKQRTLLNSHYVPECSMKLLSLDSYTTAQLFTPMLSYKYRLLLIWPAAKPALASASENPSFKVSPSFASLLCLFTMDKLRFSEPKRGLLYIFVWLHFGGIILHPVKSRLLGYISQWVLTNKIYFHPCPQEILSHSFSKSHSPRFCSDFGSYGFDFP